MKARGKYKTFDDLMEDLRQYSQKHGHTNVPINAVESFAKVCMNARLAHKNLAKEECNLYAHRRLRCNRF